MATKSFTFSAQATDGLSVEAGALTTVTRKGTSTNITTYTDSGLTTPASNPHVANALGICGPLYWSDAVEAEVTFSVTTADAATTLLQVDYADGTFTASYVQVGQLTLFEETATGDGSDTIFVLEDVVASSPYQMNVTIDGLLQNKGSYTVTSDGTDTTVTFSEAPPNGGVIWFTAATLQALSETIAVDQSSATVLATGSATSRTLADWMQRIDYYVKPAGSGSDSLSAITTAIAAAGAGGVVSLIPGQDYELSSNINLNLDDQTFLIPAGSSLTLRSGVSQPAFRINADRCSIIGAGPSTSKIDCVGRQNGIVINSGSVGMTVAGLSIIDPLNRGIIGTDCFSATSRMVWKNIWVVYTTVGTAAVGMTYIPLMFNIQGDLAVDVENFEIIDCVADASAFTVEQIAEMGYPSSGSPNINGMRVNQSGTGFIKNGKIRGNRVILPTTTDGDNWNPTTYGNAPDGAGLRRPTCLELKTTAANQVLDVDFDDNWAIGGALGHSFGTLSRIRYNNNRAEDQTDYCLEAATGEQMIGDGNYFGGRYAGKVVSTTNMERVHLTNSTIYGPSTASSSFASTATAVATTGVDEMNLDGTRFIAMNASIPMWRIDGDTQTIQARNCTFDGRSLAGVDAIQVETGTVTDLDISGSTFMDVTGYSLDIASGGVVTNLKTFNCTGRSAGGFNNAGTVTNHHQGNNTNISGLAGRAPTMSGVNYDTANVDLQYQGTTFFGLRAASFTLHTGTSDAADDRYFAFCGGGAAGEFRGATLYLYGNEEGTSPGKVVLQSGVNRNIEIDARGIGDTVFMINGTEVARINSDASLQMGSTPTTVLDPSRGIRGRSYTSTELDAIGGAVNTTDKAAGKMVWNSTVSKPVWAVGSTAASVWVDGAGTTINTPV